MATGLFIKDDGTMGFKIPEQYKKVKYSEWPEQYKKEYQAWRKDGNEKRDAAKEEKWTKLLKMLEDNAEAFNLALEIKSSSVKRPTVLTDIFGTENVNVGDSVPFSLALLKKVDKVNEKGKVSLDIKDNMIIVTAINE